MVAAADFEIRRSDGSVLYRYSGFKHRRFDWAPELSACLFPPKWDFASSFSRPFDTYTPGILGCRIDGGYFGFLDKNQAIFLQAVAHCVLTSRERLIWRDLPAAGPRRPLWLIGRIAAKEVVQRWARERHGTVLHRLAIEIRTDDRGKPFASVDRGILDVAIPDLSISHSGATAVVVIAELADSAVGVDMEEYPAGVAPAAPERAFVQDEIHLAAERSIALIDLWCAKEAAAKALGLGLLGEPRRWQVRAIGTSNDRMAVSFAAFSVPVTLFRLGDASVAIAHAAPALAAAAQRHAASELAPQI